MSNIPSARKKLRAIANSLEADGLGDSARQIREVIQDEMTRRSAARRAPIKSSPITERVKQRIIDLAETTDLHGAEIAVQLNVNPGRVSEVLQGDR